MSIKLAQFHQEKNICIVNAQKSFPHRITTGGGWIGVWMLMPFQEQIILEVVYKVIDGLKNQGICHFSKNRLSVILHNFVKMSL